MIQHGVAPSNFRLNSNEGSISKKIGGPPVSSPTGSIVVQRQH